MSEGPRLFRFRLERILRLRRNELRSAEGALRESEGEARRLEAAADGAREDAARHSAAIAAALRHGAGGLAHAGRVARHDAVARHSERSAESARAARGRARAERAAWVAVQRGVRALELLRERVRERFDREEERRSQQAIDEVATRMRRRRGVTRWGIAALLLATLATPARAEVSEEDTSSALSADRWLIEIRDRQAAFDRRERELEAREATVQELEARVVARLEELKSLRADLEEGLSSLDEESELRVRQLAKMYASMPPERAAPLLEEIDRDLATAVLRRMKHKKSAAVMALLSRPAALSLSRRVALPLVRGEGGR